MATEQAKATRRALVMERLQRLTTEIMDRLGIDFQPAPIPGRDADIAQTVVLENTAGFLEAILPSLEMLATLEDSVTHVDEVTAERDELKQRLKDTQGDLSVITANRDELLRQNENLTDSLQLARQAPASQAPKAEKPEKEHKAK